MNILQTCADGQFAQSTPQGCVPMDGKEHFGLTSERPAESIWRLLFSNEGNRLWGTVANSSGMLISLTQPIPMVSRFRQSLILRMTLRKVNTPKAVLILCRRLCYLFHLALAAFWAISDFCSAVNLAARATPPFNPPRRPRATAAGFFSLGGSASGTTVSRTCRAISEGSGCLLERLGILEVYAKLVSVL